MTSVRTARILLALLLSLASTSAGRLAAQVAHPLDRLTAGEIEATSRIVRAHPGFPAGGLFSIISLHEPPKSEILSYEPGDRFERRTFAVVMDMSRNITYEAIVDLSEGAVESWKEIPDVQPQVFVSEYDAVPVIVKADPRWQEAMRRRGITDFDSVQIDTWAVGDMSGRFGGRLLRALSYYKGSAINFYGRPIEGVTALVDMNARRIVSFTDGTVLPVPPPGQELDTASIGTRAAPRPLVTTQPEGVSFTLKGNEIEWQGWNFRFSMGPREGLMLHTVGYRDRGKVRPVLYKGSLSEMVVPYSDPDSNWNWRNAFDVGEYGVGRLSSPLEAGVDVPANAVLLDAVFADDSGGAYTLPSAIGIYERDGGLLWKHYDTYTGTNESRRARELVLMSVACIGNYDYSVSWIFHQDGTLEVDAGLTGIMLPKGVENAGPHAHGSAFGHLVSPNVIAPHHQHFFCFRLDLDVDGRKNSVSEINSAPIPAGEANPLANSFSMTETLLKSESGAARRVSMESARIWNVFNPVTMNSLGNHCGYAILPGATSVPFASPESSVRRRAGFVDNHFWSTRYHPDEMYAAGPYPNQSRGGDGLPRWIADDESVEKEDLVVWYTMGITHIPRPEEWPVMPVSHLGFRLVPVGFFSRNPALDVPR